MSVPKGKRTTSEVIYFSHAYTVMEKVVKYILADFGTTKTYRDLHVFAYKAKMSADDKEKFKELVDKYHLELETSYPEYIFCYFRESILEHCKEMISLISKAHTMYPNSAYEFNVRRQYQTDAISACYDMKHLVQIAIKIFNSNNLEKFVPIINDIDKEIEYLKTWRKDCNRFKKSCYENDERNKILAAKRVEKQIEKQKEPDDTFLARVINVSKIDRHYLIDNMKKAEFYTDEFGRVKSTLMVPAIFYTSPDGKKIKNIGIC